MSGAGRNFVAFACGRTRSGKSHLLHTIAGQFPRRLILDFVGEYSGEIPGALDTYSLLETVDALRSARRKDGRWTVNACIDPADVPQLLVGLAPIGAATDFGFSRAVGGLVLEIGEIDLIAPNRGKIHPAVWNLFARGRHHSLSILAAARRPAEAHRIVTSQADVICAFQQHEPRDADYLAELMARDVAPLIDALPERHYLRYLPNFRLLEEINAAGQVVREHVHATV